MTRHFIPQERQVTVTYVSCFSDFAQHHVQLYFHSTMLSCDSSLKSHVLVAFFTVLSKKLKKRIVLMLLNIPVNSYGHDIHVLYTTYDKPVKITKSLLGALARSVAICCLSLECKLYRDCSHRSGIFFSEDLVMKYLYSHNLPLLLIQKVNGERMYAKYW